MKTQELKEKIQKLINFSNKLGEGSKNLSRLLYQQFYEIVELERLENLDSKYLAAYLLWKSIMRANYQPELLKITPQGRQELLAAIEKEIELVELQNQKEISNELTTEELLTQLGLRIKSKEVKSDGNYLYLTDENNKQIASFDIQKGEFKKI